MTWRRFLRLLFGLSAQSVYRAVTNSTEGPVIDDDEKAIREMNRYFNEP